jgi:hypothetical protein
MPTFSFLNAPEILTNRLQCRLECSPTINLLLRRYAYARLLSTHDRSTSELLRTL